MGPCLALLLSLAAALPPLPPGDPVEVEGSRLAPPASMRQVDPALLRGSVALLPLVAGEAPRRLVAGFSESVVDDPATLWLGRVERPLQIDASARGGAASAIAGHFRGELELEVVVERPALVRGPRGLRLEARAHPRLGRGPERTVRFALVPAGGVHYVLVASFPAAREAELEQALTAAFDSFEPAAAPLPARPPNLALRAAAFGATGALVAGLLEWWRRRRRRRREAAGEG